MKLVALVSGGKDSVFNIMKCMDHGHDVVCLANLFPANTEVQELDSFMYQTVGHQHINIFAACMGLPLIRRPIRGECNVTTLSYNPESEDEVEDLLELLIEVKARFPDVTGVASGAILSTYQRNRVESVCSRLKLNSLAYLWQRDQKELLREMSSCKIKAMIIKIAAMGLHKVHLGHTTDDLITLLTSLEHIHPCGEGGEYETFVIDCPLFKWPMKITAGRTVMIEDNPIAPVGIWLFSSCTDAPECFPVVVEDHRSTSPSYPPSQQVLEITQVRENHMLRVASVGSCTAIGGVCKSLITGGTDYCPEPIEQEVHFCLQHVKACLEAESGSLKDVFYVHIYCRDMSLFPRINAAYSSYFGAQPPSRATICVSTLSSELMFEVFARKPVLQDDDTAKVAAFESLHVQSISEWAPACIGPYSQAFRVGTLVFFSGMIGLVPETMQLPPNDPTGADEMRFALRSLQRVAAAMNTECSAAMLVVVYVTEHRLVEAFHRLWVDAVKKEWSGIFRAIQVTALPRGCRVEVEMVTALGKTRVKSTSLAYADTYQACSHTNMLSIQWVQGPSGLAFVQLAISVSGCAKSATQETIDILFATKPGFRRQGSLRWYHVPGVNPDAVFVADELPNMTVTFLPVPWVGLADVASDWVLELMTWISDPE